MSDEKKIEEAILTLGITREVAAEFELFSISEPADLTRQVARKIRDRLDVYAGMMEFIIQPDQTVSSMNEYSFFNEQEHREIVQLYRKLMSILRAYSVADLKVNDSEFLHYINSALAVWNEIKNSVLKVATQLQAGWDREEPLHVERGYLG